MSYDPPEPTADPEAAALAAEIEAMAAECPHLITSWSARGAVHRSCSCGRGTPPAGVLTAATAETFVSKCRAAQDEREEAQRRATQRPVAEATPAAPAPADPGAGTGTPGTAETISGPRLSAVLDVLAPMLDGERIPIFEWGHETTPTLAEVRELATRIVSSLDAL